jgi:hypothetical protein
VSSSRIRSSSARSSRTTRYGRPILATDAYRAFATRVTAACEAVEEPGDLQIKKALPVVNDRLNMMQAEVKMLRANVERVEEKVDRLEGKVDMRHDRLEEEMDKLAADMRELKTLVQKQGSGKSLRSSTVRTAAAIRVRAADPDPHPGNPRPSGPNVVQTLGSGSPSAPPPPPSPPLAAHPHSRLATRPNAAKLPGRWIEVPPTSQLTNWWVARRYSYSWATSFSSLLTNYQRPCSNYGKSLGKGMKKTREANGFGTSSLMSSCSTSR